MIKLDKVTFHNMSEEVREWCYKAYNVFDMGDVKDARKKSAFLTKTLEELYYNDVVDDTISKIDVNVVVSLLKSRGYVKRMKLLGVPNPKPSPYTREREFTPKIEDLQNEEKYYNLYRKLEGSGEYNRQSLIKWVWLLWKYKIDNALEIRVKKGFRCCKNKTSLFCSLLQYGKEVGVQKFNDYITKQRDKNKIDNMNMTKEEFKAYNKSRSITLETMTLKYGKKYGTMYYNDYTSKQKDNGNTLKYFVEKYGEVKGQLEYERVCDAKRHTFENFKLRYGSDKTKEEFTKYLGGMMPRFSKSSLELIEPLVAKLLKGGLNEDDLFYAESEKLLRDGTNRGRFDLTIESKKVIIEFHGDYWHGNPNKYGADHDIRGVKASEKWQRDEQKRKLAEKQGYDYIVVWEADFKKDKNGVIDGLYNRIMG